MLGKMLKDGWFAEDVLEDPTTASPPEEAPNPEAARKIADERGARGVRGC
jgi:hypothetical protein